MSHWLYELLIIGLIIGIITRNTYPNSHRIITSSSAVVLYKEEMAIDTPPDPWPDHRSRQGGIVFEE